MADFFISYSRTDSAVADKLYSSLISRGFSAWMDREKLEGGQQFAQVIPQQIDSCKCFLVLLSPASVNSNWVEKEVQFAEAYNKLVIPLHIQSHSPYILLINKHYIDFKDQPFDRAVDSLILSFRSGGAQQRQPNTPPVPIDALKLYREGLEAQRQGDLELTLVQWNQILTQEPGYLNGDLAIAVKKAEEQVRPQRVQRIIDRVRTVFTIQQWPEMVALLNSLRDLDARGSADLAIKLLVDGANICSRAGQWDHEITLWDQVIRWKADYPHAQKRKEVAITNQAQSPRYATVHHYVRQNNTALAKQEILALWQSAPYYGDPENFARSLGVTVPASITDTLIQADKRAIRLQQRQAEEQKVLREREQREQEISHWCAQEKQTQTTSKGALYTDVGNIFWVIGIILNIIGIIGYIGFFTTQIPFILTGNLIGIVVVGVVSWIMILLGMLSHSIGDSLIGRSPDTRVPPQLIIIIEGLEMEVLLFGRMIGFRLVVPENDMNIIAIVMYVSVIGMMIGLIIFQLVVPKNDMIRRNIDRHIDRLRAQKRQAAEQQYQQQLTEIRRKYADVK